MAQVAALPHAVIGAPGGNIGESLGERARLASLRETPDGRVKVGGNLDAGQPHAGKLRQASIILPKGLDGQQVILRAELEVKGVRRPVRWACHEKTKPDGSLTIRLKKGSDPNWAKGV